PHRSSPVATRRSAHRPRSVRGVHSRARWGHSQQPTCPVPGTFSHLRQAALGHGTADDAFVSSARGAVGDPFTFGTDVVGFDAVLGRETDVRIRTEQDALLVGVLSLVAPMRT